MKNTSITNMVRPRIQEVKHWNNNSIDICIMAAFKLTKNILTDKKENNKKYKNLIVSLTYYNKSEMTFLTDKSQVEDLLYELYHHNQYIKLFYHVTKLESKQSLETYDGSKELFEKGFYALKSEVSNEHLKLYYEFTKMDIMSLIEHFTINEITESFLDKSIFIFEGMSWKEVAIYFKSAGFIVSGGNTTERHILSNTQCNLALVVNAIESASKDLPNSKGNSVNNNQLDRLFKYNKDFFINTYIKPSQIIDKPKIAALSFLKSDVNKSLLQDVDNFIINKEIQKNLKSILAQIITEDTEVGDVIPLHNNKTINLTNILTNLSRYRDDRLKEIKTIYDILDTVLRLGNLNKEDSSSPVFRIKTTDTTDGERVINTKEFYDVLEKFYQATVNTDQAVKDLYVDSKLDNNKPPRQNL